MTHRFPATTVILAATSALFYWAAAATRADFGFVAARPSALTALTSIFAHDPDDIGHLVYNMAFLLPLGAIVELRRGGALCLLVYIASGVAGAAVHGLADPTSTTPLVGASGAILGLAAVAAALEPRITGAVLGVATLNIWCLLGGASVGETVSYACHTGGFIAGVAFALIFARSRASQKEVA